MRLAAESDLAADPGGPYFDGSRGGAERGGRRGKPARRLSRAAHGGSRIEREDSPSSKLTIARSHPDDRQCPYLGGGGNTDRSGDERVRPPACVQMNRVDGVKARANALRTEGNDGTTVRTKPPR